MDEREILRQIEQLKQSYRNLQNASPKTYEDMMAQEEQMEYIEEEIERLEAELN